jgi:succinyl-CoA synthetase beta subunit
MKIHEYQAKQILAEHGVAVPGGSVASTVKEAVEAAENLQENGARLFVVKAQIHAGGRWKGHTKNSGASGVILCKTMGEVKNAAESLLDDVLVTKQTGETGQQVQRVYVTDGVDIKQEFYLGILLDRARGRNVLMVSTEGGMAIEEVAAETPEKIIKEWVEPGMPLQHNQARHLAYELDLEGSALKKAVKLIMNLYQCYQDIDASLVEVNPLVLTPDDEVYALDAKVTLDDNALFRHPEAQELLDKAEINPAELEASDFGLNYVKLEGNVGCMVNGAGLAMATMDIIKLSGGEPANFLDVGGSANAETVKNGFRIILEDESVRAILINIFGGIVRCDRVSNGVIEAVKDPEIAKKVEEVPIIVRLQGTNAEKAKKIIDGSDLNVISAVLLKEAAEEVSKVLAA